MFPKESRTALSIRNIKVNTALNVIVLFLQFFSRKIFIVSLGTEVIGLNSTAYNMLEFLNFAELGIVGGVRFMLYRPYLERDYATINELITLQGHIYRWISLVITALAVVLMCLFPMIFSKMELPLWYAYASFGVLLYYYLLGNFVNYRQVMFHVSQHTYRLGYYTMSLAIAKVCFQIVTIHYLSHGYLWWLTSEFVFTSLTGVVVYRVTQRDYPFLRKSPLPVRCLIKKYKLLVVKVKQLFFHRIGAIVLTKTTPVIIYAFTTLTEVTLYGNYMMLVHGVDVISNISFGSISSGIGNLVAENNREKSKRVFHEVFAVRVLMAGIFAFVIATLSSPFISLWLGADYVLGSLTIQLIVASLVLNMLRLPFDMYIQAAGLFQDIWAPIFETVLNLGFAVAGGYFFGLDGILGGSMVGTSVIVLLWKPYFLFREGFGSDCCALAWQMVRLGGAAVASVLLEQMMMRCLPLESGPGWGGFILYALASCGVFGAAFVLLAYVADSSLRRFVGRFV